MPYTSGKFPRTWKNVEPATRSKAVEVLNALLKEGMDEGKAIPIALSRAREFVRNHAMKMSRGELMAKCRKEHPDWTPEQHKAWVEKMAEHSNAIAGIEIFSTGTHNGDVYTETDLDEMVRAHAALDFCPALKVGHSKDSPGAPAYGWVQNVRRVGAKLVADFTDMHDSVVEALRKRAYDRVSSEVYFNLNRGGQTFRRALKAVALLGAEVPAVAGLTPLHKMEFAAEGEFERFTAHEQALDVSPEAVFGCLNERASALIKQLSTQEYDMKTKSQELQERLDALTEQLDAIGQDGADDKKKAETIKQLSAEIEAVATEIKTLTQQDAAERAALAESLKISNARIAELEADGRRRAVAEKVGGIKVPAFRPGLEAMYSYALSHAAEKVKVYAKDKEGKEIATDQTLVEIADAFTVHVNAQAEKLFKSFAMTGSGAREEGNLDDPNEDAGVALDRKAKAYMVAHPEVKDYMLALQRVQADNPELARQYAERHSN